MSESFLSNPEILCYQDIIYRLEIFCLLQGHDLILNILDHLHTLMTSDVSNGSSSAAVLYEKVFLTMVSKFTSNIKDCCNYWDITSHIVQANFLLESLPASDKAFGRLLGEVPSLPDSAMKLLDDLCCSTMMDPSRAVTRDGDRVTQGLGAVWSLILARPQYREACLKIALKVIFLIVPGYQQSSCLIFLSIVLFRKTKKANIFFCDRINFIDN